MRHKLGTTFPTANAAIKVAEALGIVTDLTGQKNRLATTVTFRTGELCIVLTMALQVSGGV